MSYPADILPLPGTPDNYTSSSFMDEISIEPDAISVVHGPDPPWWYGGLFTDVVLLAIIAGVLLLVLAAHIGRYGFHRSVEWARESCCCSRICAGRNRSGTEI